VQPVAVPRVVPDDAEDDQVLACALAANAELIVSGDKHLLSLGSQYQGMPIVTPAQAAKLIRSR
jgi:predicted nucleic acid-binding protein